MESNFMEKPKKKRGAPKKEYPYAEHKDLLEMRRIAYSKWNAMKKMIDDENNMIEDEASLEWCEDARRAYHRAKTNVGLVVSIGKSLPKVDSKDRFKFNDQYLDALNRAMGNMKLVDAIYKNFCLVHAVYLTDPVEMEY